MSYLIVNEDTRDIDRYTLYYPQIWEKTRVLLEFKKDYDLSVVFVDDAKIQTINREYRGIDRVTDVISFASLDAACPFELEQETVELGDIFISIDAIERQAIAYGHSPQREASFLFTHGILHLLGYDHMEKTDEEEMFALQDRILDDIIKK